MAQLLVIFHWFPSLQDTKAELVFFRKSRFYSSLTAIFPGPHQLFPSLRVEIAPMNCYMFRSYSLLCYTPWYDEWKRLIQTCYHCNSCKFTSKWYSTKYVYKPLSLQHTALRPKTRARNSRWVFLARNSDSHTWAITCCLLVYALAGNWNQKQDWRFNPDILTQAVLTMPNDTWYSLGITTKSRRKHREFSLLLQLPCQTHSLPLLSPFYTRTSK